MKPKQPLSLFFGATNQDASKKTVRIGDLVKAENVQQVKGGEFSKRPGFTQVAQTYPGGAISPDSIVSPDGVQVLTRDAATDHVFARSSTNTVNQDQGHADRFVPYVRTRFPALGSGEQQSPMAKQAGKYMVWLIDEGHFQIAELNPNHSADVGSTTGDAETIVSQSGPISVAAITTPDTIPASTQIKSFAVVDCASFDATHLWIVWVDWSGSIFAWRVPHSNLKTGTFSTVYTHTEPGETSHSVFTSVSMGTVDAGNTSPTPPLMAIAACGVIYDTTAAYARPAVAGVPAIGFRSATATLSNYAQEFSAHMYLNAATGASAVGSDADYLWGGGGWMVAAACTIVSVAGGFQTSHDKWYYAFIGSSAGSNGARLNLVGVPYNAPTSFTAYHTPISSTDPDTYGRPDDFSANDWSHFGWFYSGQIAAKETATGVDIAVTIIKYYNTAAGVFRAWNPDYLLTQLWRFAATNSWSLIWTKLGACVAQGWIRLRDYTVTGAGAVASGKDYLLTIWEDKEALQSCYHLREWGTGDIVAQVAYGEAAHVGHVATRDLQVQQCCTDVQQPMLGGVNPQDGSALSIVVGIQSQNQNGCVDIAVIVLQHWDFQASAKPVFQNPQVAVGLALAPGPVPTIANGFQRLQEAGPLVYPSRPETFLGESST